MIVAIIAAVRTNWKDEGNQKDALYFWRNAHSNIWYSSEIVGTIIVQCIPVLRPLLRDLNTSRTSRKLASIPDDRAGNGRRPPTIGQGSSHRAHIYSDARSMYNEKDEVTMDSWDTQGIYTKIDFELTTLELKGHKVKDHEVKDQKTKEPEGSNQKDKHLADFSFV
jgi:hypothetical protein